jgi:hypothetical protein
MLHWLFWSLYDKCYGFLCSSSLILTHMIPCSEVATFHVILASMHLCLSTQGHVFLWFETKLRTIMCFSHSRLQNYESEQKWRDIMSHFWNNVCFWKCDLHSSNNSHNFPINTEIFLYVLVYVIHICIMFHDLIPWQSAFLSFIPTSLSICFNSSHS